MNNRGSFFSRIKQLSTLLLIFGAAFGVVAAYAAPAQAVTGADWRAGRIIDDGIFRNVHSMSIQDIQNFLNAKNPGCDPQGTKPSEYGGGTRAQYSASRGYPAPFTCLKDYYENINTKENNLDGRPIPAGAMSAAQIIYHYAQQYVINPQVLIVLLQKEQTLVTDEWPWSLQYRTATGYGCPDTAPCDSQYYGFSNQIRWASRMFQAIMDNDPNWFAPYGTGVQSIRYSPNAACGSSNVNVENRATAALYNYTPYQPNNAALDNLYGTGNECSAYGNRNFWRLFNDWFGNTHAPNYLWQNYGNVQYAYTDSSKTTPVDLRKLLPGQRVYIGFYAQNMGNITWKNSGSNPTRAGTARPFDRISPFCDVSWLGCARPGNLREGTVAPGQVGSFEFWMTAPSQPGAYLEYFKPMIEGVAWMNDSGMHFYTEVGDKYTWENAGNNQYAYTNDSKTTPVDLTKLVPGQRVYIGFKAKNTGNKTWTNSGPNPTRAGTARSDNRTSPFCDSSWISCVRPANMLEASVAPGQTGTFEFWYTAPFKGGTYREYFKPMVEGLAWMNDSGMHFYSKVQDPVHTWVNEGFNQYAYTNDNKTTPVDLTNLQPNQRVYIGFKAKNTGTTVWRKSGFNQTRAGSSRPIDRNSPFCDTSWPGCNRPASMVESTVLPGQTATFEFWYKAPSTPGTYYEYFRPVTEGVSWSNDSGMHFYSVVK